MNHFSWFGASSLLIGKPEEMVLMSSQDLGPSLAWALKGRGEGPFQLWAYAWKWHRDSALIATWLKEFQHQPGNESQWIIDAPFTAPFCHQCPLPCPGLQDCARPEFQQLKGQLQDLLVQDGQSYQAAPKRYEQQRLASQQVSVLGPQLGSIYGQPTDALAFQLSPALKRRLREDFLPYRHRGLDLWVWMNYQELWPRVFRSSFDPWGSMTSTHQGVLNYVQRFFKPLAWQWWESSGPLILLELYRAGVVTWEQLSQWQGPLATGARAGMLKKLQQHASFPHLDQTLMNQCVASPKWFHSYLLFLAAQAKVSGAVYEIDACYLADGQQFVAPHFLRH